MPDGFASVGFAITEILATVAICILEITASEQKADIHASDVVQSLVNYIIKGLIDGW